MLAAKSALIALILLLGLQLPSATAQETDTRDGKMRVTADDNREAWDARNAEWVPVETFWLRYADRRGGLTWGRRTSLPPYNEVKELDTMIWELDSGPCLMEFFHRRWRRANDVRRWDTGFNDYGGCPHVFD